MKTEKILVTGCAGFIGMHLCKRLLSNDFIVYGIDNINSYYDIKLKKARLNRLSINKNFKFFKADLNNEKDINKIFENTKPNKVVNLAAQAGVRYSIENPHAYIDSNVKGFLNILENCKVHDISGLIYASSSSVYGANQKVPFSIKDRIDKPISIYAVSKITNELMAKTYSHLHGLNTTGLRFFTVYGPWGRPDMAMYIFTKKILDGEPIPLFNKGNMIRDFTYIDDIVSGIMSAISYNYHCEIFNLGNSRCENLKDVVSIIEKCLNKKAKYNLYAMQPGDVKRTFADIKHSEKKINFKPFITIDQGILKFINWYLEYHKI